MFNLLWDFGARGHRAFQRPNQIVALLLLSFGLCVPASGQKVVRIGWDYFRGAVDGWMENGSRVPRAYTRKWEMERAVQRNERVRSARERYHESATIWFRRTHRIGPDLESWCWDERTSQINE